MNYKSLCLTLGGILAATEIYLHLFASIAIQSGIETWQIDKLFHLVGGVFLATVVEWRMGHVSFWRTLAAVTVLTIVWKVFESLDPSMHRYIVAHFSAWAFDAVGDVAATVLGGLAYWRVREIPRKPAEVLAEISR